MTRKAPRFAWAVLALLSAAWIIAAPAQEAPAKVAQPGGISLGHETAAPPDASLAETERRLRASLQQNPQSADTLYELALVLRQENRPRESLTTYTSAAQLQKPTAAQLRSVALDYVLLDDYDDAIRWLRVALNMEPDNPDVLYSLGRCLYTKRLFADAEKTYLRLLTLQPDNLKAEENLGLTYDMRDEPQKAERYLRTAAQWAKERGAQDPWPYLDLGVFLLNHFRFADAQPFLEEAVKLAPDSSLAHEKLGMTLVSNGNAARGARELEIAVNLVPNDPKTHFELGRAYHAAGELDKAHAEFGISESLYGEHHQN